jgi:hypothetical protein
LFSWHIICIKKAGKKTSTTKCNGKDLKMANIVIRDLKKNELLDKKAMENILGGYAGGCVTNSWEGKPFVINTIEGRRECVKTCLDETNELVQIWRVWSHRIMRVDSYVEKKVSFCGPVCSVGVGSACG